MADAKTQGPYKYQWNSFVKCFMITGPTKCEHLGWEDEPATSIVCEALNATYTAGQLDQEKAIGEPVAWMNERGEVVSPDDIAHWKRVGREVWRTFTIPLYANTKAISIQEIIEEVKQNDKDAEGDESYTEESHLANLHNRLTNLSGRSRSNHEE